MLERSTDKDVFLLIDVSGSMGEEQKLERQDALAKKNALKVSYDGCGPKDLESALHKVTEAAVKYDRVTGDLIKD